MKHLRIALFTVTSLFALSAGAQTVDEIVDKHVEAMGGKEKLTSLKSVRTEATMSVQGMEIPIVTTRVHNVGQRVDISAMGQEGFVITTPTAGWVFFPFMGQSAAEAMPAEQLKAAQDELDIAGLLFNYKDKGYKAELLGKETVDGSEAYKIKVTTGSGFERTFFIDGKTYFISKTTAKGFVMGQETEVVATFSNYKKTDDGFVFPYTIGGAFGQGDLTVTKIEVNKPIDEKIFKVGN